MVAFNRYAIGGCHTLLRRVPFDVTAFDQLGSLFVTLQDDADVGFVVGQLDRAVEKRFVFHDAARLQTAGGRKDRLGCAVVNTHGKLVRGKTAKDHRVYSTDARAGQHRLQRLGHHRHIDNHTVALGHPLRHQRARQLGHARLQFGISGRRFAARDGAVIDDCRLITAPVLHVAVHCVVAAVDHPVREPLIKVVAAVIEGLCGFDLPVDGLGLFHPPAFGVVFPGLINLCVSHHDAPLILLSTGLGPSGRVGQDCWRMTGQNTAGICKNLAAKFAKSP